MVIGWGYVIGTLVAQACARVQVKTSWTILQRGVHLRTRVHGRLYGADLWRENQEDNNGRRR